MNHTSLKSALILGSSSWTDSHRIRRSKPTKKPPTSRALEEQPLLAVSASLEEVSTSGITVWICSTYFVRTSSGSTDVSLLVSP
ncbi:hypothetical protein Vi05172_g10799 [Venturia inaequalis]|nr:hypothetical protein Vi05172_g10799 [Venturia inaequalis]